MWRRCYEKIRSLANRNIQTVLVLALWTSGPVCFSGCSSCMELRKMVTYIKPGTYYGTVIVTEGKDFITFLVEGADSAVRTYNRKACDRKAKCSQYTILNCPTVIVQDSQFVAKDITFDNSSSKPFDFDYEYQAPAIRVSGDKSAFYSCTFLGWQDTLYAGQGMHYARTLGLKRMWILFWDMHKRPLRTAQCTPEVKVSAEL